MSFLGNNIPKALNAYIDVPVKAVNDANGAAGMNILRNKDRIIEGSQQT